MIFEIKHKITGEILFSTKESCIRIAVEMAIKAGVSLQNANLRYEIGRASCRERV